MKVARLLPPLLGVVSLLLSTCGIGSPGALGSRDNPIKIYFTPSSNAQNIADNTRPFIAFLEKETGYSYRMVVPTSYGAVVEAFGTQSADVAVMNSLGYLMAHRNYGAEAKLIVKRYGLTFYQGQIITHADAHINNLKDLEGRSFAFTDTNSGSGYLYAKKLLDEHGIELGQKVFARKHDSVVTMVYQRRVAGGACYYSPPDGEGRIRDARKKVLPLFPDVAEKVRILALTEPIPNDAFVCRAQLPAKVCNATIDAIVKFFTTSQARELFARTYSFEGVVRAKAADYAKLRETVDALQLDASELLRMADGS